MAASGIGAGRGGMTRPMTDSEICDMTDALGADLAEARERIEKLEKRIAALEADTPQARQLQHEADVAIADAREFDRHGRHCQCPYCATDEEMTR
jgi:hypothetical protein